MDWIFEQPVKAGYTLNLESRNKCAAIMERIVKEQPEYWPYGCDVSGFDDLYLVRKEADTQPVGFVGWQTREEKGARVGYYAIGILPEHRKQGFAKQAVAALLDKCASTVDKVRAFIMPNNGPSHALADSLGVDIVHKLAAVKQGGPLKSILTSPAVKNLGMGLGTGGVIDAYINGAHKSPGDYFKGIIENPDMGRLGQFLFNTGLGTAGMSALARGVKGDPKAMAAGGMALGMIPAKDLLLNLAPATREVAPSMRAWQDATKKGPGIDPKALATLLGGGILAGGGLYGANLLRKAILNRPAPRGRVKVTLPTKTKGDSETAVDLPIEDVNLSQSLVAALGRDTRRRLREESKERKWKKGKSGRPTTNAEPELRVLEDLPKAAAVGRLQSLIGK